MSSSSETVLGEVQVTAKLSLGSERLRLFFTQSRIIVAHIGKRNVGSPAMTSFFGRLSGALEDLFRSGGESLTKRGLKGSSPTEILAADRDNFSVDYVDVVSVEVSHSQTVARVVIVTKDEKLLFTTQAGSLLSKLLEDTLDGKVRVT